MFKFLRKRKAQSTVEYAILIIIVIGALLSMQAYIKRGVHGRLRSATDDIGEQFEPGATNYIQTVTSSSTTQDTYNAGATSSVISSDQTDVESSTNLLNVDQTYWGS